MVSRERFGDIEAYVTEGETGEGILYLSGWRDFGVYDEKIPELVNDFESEGFSVFAAPYRGLLGQPGEFTFDSMVDDAVEYAEILADYSGAETITAVGNCVGGIAAFGAAAESELVSRVVSMNTLFALRNDPWWNAEDEYRKRTARWRMVEKGEKGPLGTEFRGLEEDYYKDVVCTGQDKVALDERLDEFVHKPIYLMVSHKDEKIDPLHTWTMYRYIRSKQAEDGVKERARIEVIPEVDESHTLLLEDSGLHRKVVDWIGN